MQYVGDFNDEKVNSKTGQQNTDRKNDAVEEKQINSDKPNNNKTHSASISYQLERNENSSLNLVADYADANKKYDETLQEYNLIDNYMQLIKNALLSQDRTLCRKIEEAILTLLMENYYKVSKRDILEMYLNMIEFAPNVYGIEDASFFYFGKSCTTLSITEIVTLTYVIPRPIFFYKALLQKTEQLSTNLYRHAESCGKGILLYREKLHFSISGFTAYGKKCCY